MRVNASGVNFDDEKLLHRLRFANNEQTENYIMRFVSSKQPNRCVPMTLVGHGYRLSCNLTRL